MENAPPAPRRPGELRSARPGLILFCANLLLAVVVVGSYVWPRTTGATRRQPAPPVATPTTATFDVGALPEASPTSAPIHAQATATATATAISRTGAGASPTATRAIPTATPTPKPTVAIMPTPSPTVASKSG